MSKSSPLRFQIPLGVALALAAQAAVAAETCSPEALREVAAKLAAPRAVLQKALAAHDPDPELAPPLRQAISRLKPAVAELVDAHLRCLPAGQAPDLPALAATLHAAANGDEEDNSSGSGDGNVDAAGDNMRTLRFEPAFIAEAGWLAVVAGTGIPCGSDAQLLLYAPRDGLWQRLLRWASADYARIDGAWEALQYRVSPRDAQGRRFVAVSHIRPWCSSTWSSIDYSVLRPAAHSDKPELLLQGSDSLWWGGEDFGRLSVDARHFELRFHAASLDSGVHNREFVRRYDLGGAVPRRVVPVAAEPRDFVDEWIVSEWGEARQWSAVPQGVLQSRHRALHALRQRYAPFEFGAISVCADGAGTQVELRSGEDAVALYFRVEGMAAADYRLHSIADTPDPQCTVQVRPQD